MHVEVMNLCSLLHSAALPSGGDLGESRSVGRLGLTDLHGSMSQ